MVLIWSVYRLLGSRGPCFVPSAKRLGTSQGTPLALHVETNTFDHVMEGEPLASLAAATVITAMHFRCILHVQRRKSG